MSSGRVDIQDITIVRGLDADTPDLMQSCSSDPRLKGMIIDMEVKAGPGQKGLRRITISIAKVIRREVRRKGTTVQERFLLRCRGVKTSDS
jgi:hypothetical protein